MEPLQVLYTRAMIKAYSLRNRRDFLHNCLLEMVAPKCTPKQLLQSDHPFPPSLRAYLEESKTSLMHQCTEAFDNARSMGHQLRGQLSPAEAVIIRTKITRANEEQKRQQSRKLEELCINSKWSHIGNCDIIVNLSNRVVTGAEKEALSLGLKFASGVKKNNQNIDLITKNHRSKDSDYLQGFIQGILTVALNEPVVPSIPRRFISVLKNLASDTQIKITKADKGEGVVIMNTTNYIQKMNDLLGNNITYEKVTENKLASETKKFSQKARKILKKSEAGSKLQYMIPSNPKPASMYGLPKTHKPNIPMRPITSGIGSAPHKLAGLLAKHLSNLLGKISDAHLKNSGDLLGRIKGTSMRNKKMASLDVTSLFTKVPTDKAINLLREHVTPDKLVLPIPHQDFIDLVELCINFNYFIFNQQSFKQKFGMAMGNPISAVLANLFMESLESGPFAQIIPPTVTWLRYVDDILVITPRRFNLENFQAQLNEVELSIQFTIEHEVEEKLPFLDTLLIRDGNDLKFKVYRKPTNKDDLINFYSHHNIKIKRGVLIGFFLRALRICSPEYLEEECSHIANTFHKLKFPSHFIKKCKKKAIQIYSTPRPPKPTVRRIILPTGQTADIVSCALKNSGLEVVTVTSQTLKDLSKHPQNFDENTTAGVYVIPCNSCPKQYVGETSRSVQIRVKEHETDLRKNKTSNACVMHRDLNNHFMKWDSAKLIIKESNTIRRKCYESALIQSIETIEQNRGMFHLAKPLAKLILHKRKLPTHDPLNQPP